jgi:hypothetical protein
MVIVGALLLVGLTVFLILQPIISGNGAPLGSSVQEPSEAQFKKRVSLLQLRDAEYEFAMGKLGEEDYQALKNEISAEALDAIREEKAEAVRTDAGMFEGPTDHDLEAEIASVRSRLTNRIYCSECGYPNPSGSRFCGDCGGPLEPPESSSPS